MNTTMSSLQAKDLSQQAPRGPRERINGYVLMARMIDKGRATLAGTNHEYHFNCPLDNMLFSFKGLDGEEVRKVLASGATDQEIARWIETHGTPKTKEDVEAWSRQTEQVSFYTVPEKREWFSGECRRLGLDPAKTTLFEYLEVDDRESYKNRS
jgi:hypothetical protein